MSKGGVSEGIMPGSELDGIRLSLTNGIARRVAEEGVFATAVPGLSLYRCDQPTELFSCMLEPSICLTVQGSKRIVLGEATYAYDIRRFLLVSVGAPVPVQILEASAERPYYSLILSLDRKIIGELLASGELPLPRGLSTAGGVALGTTELPLLKAFYRLLDVLDEPEAIHIVAPLIQREIFYRLLVSDQGARLRQIATSGSQGQRIARAVEWLKDNYTQPLRIDECAAQVQMSVSSFHQHFRALTAMSPLQYQKWLRLNEARRLMLIEQLDASSAAFRVGYESATQFSREYCRQFGAPPLRDVRQMQKGAAPVLESDQPACIAA